MNPSIAELNHLLAQAHMDFQFFEFLLWVGFEDEEALDGYMAADESRRVIRSAIEDETCEGI